MVLNNNRNTLLLSTAYFPPVEYFANIAKYNRVEIEQHETYPKQTYRNRCHIYTEKGKMALSVPVTKVYGKHSKTNEIELFNDERWQVNHWRAIESAYISSPFFLYYRDDLIIFYKEVYKKLLDFNTALTNHLCRIIGIGTEMGLTQEYVSQPDNTIDLRTAIHPKKDTVTDHFPEYIQVFEERHGFIQNLSIIDLLFNLGPETKGYLENLI